MPSIFLFLWVWPVVVTSTIVFGTLVLTLFPIVYFIDSDRRFLHEAATLWGKSIVSLYPNMRVSITGDENLPPPEKPVIYVANHLSQADILVLFLLNRQFRWMAKASLFRIPILGWAMRAIGYIPVARQNSRASHGSLCRCKQLLKSGVSVLFFPEGTRSTNGVTRPFRMGAFKLAIETKTSIVPISIVGTEKILQNGSCFPQGAHVSMHIHPQIEVSNTPEKVFEIAQKTRDVILSKLPPQNTTSNQDLSILEDHVKNYKTSHGASV